MAKMNSQVLKERLGTSRLNDIFLEIYPYDPTSKFQELEIGSGLTFMQSINNYWMRFLWYRNNQVGKEQGFVQFRSSKLKWDLSRC